MPFYIIPRKHNLKKHTFIFIPITTCIEKKKKKTYNSPKTKFTIALMG